MNFICSVCGKHCKSNTIDTAHCPHKFVCFDCAFWLDKLSYCDDPNHVRIDGHYFVVSDGNHNGFGGREFRIIRNDGKELITKDLWCLGKIDGNFTNRLPDNARFAPIVKPHMPNDDDVPF